MTPEEIQAIKFEISGGDCPRPHADYEDVFRRIWPEVSHLGGDVAEFGVYNGGNCFTLSRITGRRVWAFDTFAGIPAEDYIEGLDFDVPGAFAPTFDLSTVHPIHGIIPIKGRFAKTLSWFPLAFPMFSMVLVDVDLYCSAQSVFAFLPRHLVPGGIIILDDWPTHAGIQKALREFLRLYPKAQFESPNIIRGVC